MSLMTVDELNDLMRREFPQSQTILEAISSRSSGPTMMSLADTAMYLALLAEIGPVLLAVTTNLNIHFVRKPEPERDLIGECSIFKLGKKLAVGEVKIFSEGIDDVVAHATCTYSIPER